MEETRSFAPLLLVVFLAFLVPVLLSRVKRVRLPIIVGEIIAGVIVGRSGLGWVQSSDPVLELLSEFGFAFLMFLSGMEIDFSNLGTIPVKRERANQSQNKAQGSGVPTNSQRLQNSREGTIEEAHLPSKLWGPLPLGVIIFLLTLSLSTVIGFGLVRLDLARNPWMIALILSTTSLGVVLPVLKERGLSSGRYGQTLLITALIADFATMLLITVLVAAVSHGVTVEILFVGILFVAFFLVYRIGTLFFRRVPGIRRAMEELSHATAQIKVRAAFTMMLIFIVLSQVLGAEIILGAFLAGAIIALLRTPEDSDLASQLEAIGFGFFIPIFFIKVGVDFNLQALAVSAQSLLLVPLLLLAALLVKFVPALIFHYVFSWRETLAAGSLLSARLSLIIAASAIGLRLGIIRESVNAAIILVAILTVTTAPLIFLRLVPSEGEKRIKPILVIGAGELGMQVAEGLQAHSEQVILFDVDQTRIDRARQRGISAHAANLDPPDAEFVACLEAAGALVCTFNDTEHNYRICLQARTVFGLEHVVAQVSHPNELERFEQIGVTTMNAALDRAALLVLLTRNPALYSLLTRTEDNKEVTELVVLNPECVGKALREMRLPGDVLVLALRRNGELLVPHGNTSIESGDHLTVAGSQEYIQTVRDLFARPESLPLALN